MRPLRGNVAPVSACAGVRASLQPQPQPLVLGHAPAPAGRPGRHPARGDPRLRRPKGTRRRPAPVRDRLHGGELIVCDKGYAGRDFEAHVAEAFGAQILRPARKDEHHHDPALSWIRQRIESIFWTLKDRLGLERHRARSLHGLRARIATKLLALAAGVWLNHYLGQPTRTFAQLAA